MVRQSAYSNFGDSEILLLAPQATSLGFGSGIFVLFGVEVLSDVTCLGIFSYVYCFSACQHDRTLISIL